MRSAKRKAARQQHDHNGAECRSESVASCETRTQCRKKKETEGGWIPCGRIELTKMGFGSLLQNLGGCFEKYVVVCKLKKEMDPVALALKSLQISFTGSRWVKTATNCPEAWTPPSVVLYVIGNHMP